jgi:protein-S-isoprenylcysteine O-methyltransferase Ste14
MRAYLMTTGLLFAALVLAHAWRASVEPNLVRDPVFLIFSVLALALCVWAFRLLRAVPRGASDRPSAG